MAFLFSELIALDDGWVKTLESDIKEMEG